MRLFIFSTQYRNPLDFTETALQDAQSGLERMYECLAQLATLPVDGPAGDSSIGDKDRSGLDSLVTRFYEAMDNDFNTAQALGHLFDTVKHLNKILRILPERPVTADLELLRSAGESFRTLAGVLGVLQHDPAAVIAGKKTKNMVGIDLGEEEIEQLIAKRNQARAIKDWAASDEVRDYLLGHHIVLQDSPEGTTWEVKH